MTPIHNLRVNVAITVFLFYPIYKGNHGSCLRRPQALTDCGSLTFQKTAQR